MFSLAESFRRKRYEAGYREGLRLAYEERLAKFNSERQAWYEREQMALAKGEPFSEPPPVLKAIEPDSAAIPPRKETPTPLWLSESFLQKRYEAGYAKGSEEVRAARQAWYERQQAAFARGEPFDEPPPSRNGSTDVNHS